jgi:hypothetical protein
MSAIVSSNPPTLNFPFRTGNDLFFCNILSGLTKGNQGAILDVIKISKYYTVKQVEQATSLPKTPGESTRLEISFSIGVFTVGLSAQ